MKLVHASLIIIFMFINLSSFAKSRSLFTKAELAEIEWLRSASFLEKAQKDRLNKITEAIFKRIKKAYSLEQRAQLLKSLKERPWEKMDKKEYHAHINKLLKKLEDSLKK